MGDAGIGEMQWTLQLHRPTRRELLTRQQWLRDPEIMAFNAGWDLHFAGYDNRTGCLAWPESQWDAFLDAYGCDPAVADYFYLRERATRSDVGHVHYRVNRGHHAEIGINVVPAKRGRGVGVEGLRLLLAQIWSTTSVGLVTNEFEDERESAVRLHRAVGFQPGETTECAGRSVRQWRLERPRG